MPLPTIRPIRTQAELDAVQKLANADGHALFNPTHLIQKEGEITGAFSIGKNPFMMAWTHSEKTKASDSLHLLNGLETILAHAGLDHYMMPCTEDSPYFNHMEKMGYQRMGTFTLFVKPLAVPIKAPAENSSIPFPSAVSG